MINVLQASFQPAKAAGTPLTSLSATDPLRWEMKAEKAFTLAAALFAVCCKIAMLGFPRRKDPSNRIATAAAHAAPLRAMAEMTTAARDLLSGKITKGTWDAMDRAVFTLDNTISWFATALTDDEVAAVDGLAEAIDEANRLYTAFQVWAKGYSLAYTKRRGGVR